MLFSRVARAWTALMQGKPYSTPDVTKVQQFALGQAVVVVLIVLGVNLDDSTQQLLLGLSAALPLSDAVVRRSRSANVDKLAQVQQEGDDDSGTGLTDAEREQVLAGLARLSAARPPD
jgi:hypothetical protein